MRPMITPARAAPAIPFLLVALAGCSTPAPGPAAAPATVEAVALSAQEVAFVARARAAVPRLVGTDERIAARGANTCDSLTDGRPHSQVVDVAIQRFSSGSYTVTRAEAEALVRAAGETVCA